MDRHASILHSKPLNADSEREWEMFAPFAEVPYRKLGFDEPLAQRSIVGGEARTGRPWCHSTGTRCQTCSSRVQ